MSEPFLQATLPLPTSTNASRVPVNGRLISSRELKQFKSDAHMLLIKTVLDMPDEDKSEYLRIKNMVLAASKTRNKKIPIALDITAYLETLWRRDTSNFIKALEDVVFEHMGINDNLVVDIHIRKEVDRAHPRVEIAIRIFEEVGVTA
jgi:crossover junction endodeoxyribonuclease RusA